MTKGDFSYLSLVYFSTQMEEIAKGAGIFKGLRKIVCVLEFGKEDQSSVQNRRWRKVRRTDTMLALHRNQCGRQ